MIFWIVSHCCQLIVIVSYSLTFTRYSSSNMILFAVISRCTMPFSLCRYRNARINWMNTRQICSSVSFWWVSLINDRWSCNDEPAISSILMYSLSSMMHRWTLKRTRWSIGFTFSKDAVIGDNIRMSKFFPNDVHFIDHLSETSVHIVAQWTIIDLDRTGESHNPRDAGSSLLSRHTYWQNPVERLDTRNQMHLTRDTRTRHSLQWIAWALVSDSLIVDGLAWSWSARRSVSHSRYGWSPCRRRDPVENYRLRRITQIFVLEISVYTDIDHVSCGQRREIVTFWKPFASIIRERNRRVEKCSFRLPSDLPVNVGNYRVLASLHCQRRAAGRGDRLHSAQRWFVHWWNCTTAQPDSCNKQIACRTTDHTEKESRWTKSSSWLHFSLAQFSLPRHFHLRVSWYLMTIVSDWHLSTEMCNRTDDYEMFRIDTDRLLVRSSPTFSPRETAATVSLQWSEFSFGHLRYPHSSPNTR